MAVNTAAGSEIAIGTTMAIDMSGTESEIITDFETDTYVEIGEAEDLGEFGDEASEITFTSLKNRRTRKFKGTFNAGTVTCVVGSDPSDAGQTAARAAFLSDLDYNFRITLNDQITLAGTPTVLYFRGKVMSKRRNVGNVENVVRQSFPIGVNSEIYEVAAT